MSMDVYDAIRTRKSVRAWSDRPVEEDRLERVLSAARLAPSASNRQEWRFVVVSDPDLRRRVGIEAAAQEFVAAAPIVLACCAETDGRVMRCGQAAYPIDVAIAMDHLTLAAAAEGLGTCWVGSFDEGKVREILGIPPAVRVVQLMPLGYPRDPSPVAKQRLALSAIVHRERW
jgi:nitroreductase